MTLIFSVTSSILLIDDIPYKKKVIMPPKKVEKPKGRIASAAVNKTKRKKAETKKKG